ncbi:hypothetical protein ACFSSF_15895 [Dietzia aerolata]|uniref:hypothetical protein n=1 Tax=Dietzia aerolata TaxID=595984 RepID=UPI0036380CBC
MISYNNLFVGTVVGFVVSAILVTAARFPVIATPPRRRSSTDSPAAPGSSGGSANCGA